MFIVEGFYLINSEYSGARSSIQLKDDITGVKIEYHLTAEFSEKVMGFLMGEKCKDDIRKIFQDKLQKSSNIENNTIDLFKIEK